MHVAMDLSANTVRKWAPMFAETQKEKVESDCSCEKIYSNYLILGSLIA